MKRGKRYLTGTFSLRTLRSVFSCTLISVSSEHHVKGIRSILCCRISGAIIKTATIGEVIVSQNSDVVEEWEVFDLNDRRSSEWCVRIS